jgi:hypothetical protein
MAEQTAEQQLVDLRAELAALKAGNGSVQARDTGPMGSKKFLAFLFASSTSKVLLAAGLFVLKDNVAVEGLGLWWWMITMTICVSFLEVGAILGIAYVDKFVRVAQITANQNPFAKPKPPNDPQKES